MIGRPFSDALGLRPGEAAAVVGCGGKTALISRLCAENRVERVLLSTTAHILPPPPGLADRVLEAPAPPFELLPPGVTLVTGPREGEKLAGPDAETLRALCPPDGYAFLECDGSRGLPLKGWAAHEPPVPVFCALTAGVCALWPVGLPADGTVIHRPALFFERTGCRPGQALTLGHVAAMVADERGPFKNAAGRRLLLINQVESPRALAQARELAGLLPEAFARGLSGVFAASVARGEIARIA